MTSSRRLVFPALAAAGILWGTTVPLSKVALGWLPPAWLAFGRFAIAAALLLVISRTRLRAACSPVIVGSGALGYGGAVLLQNLGVQRTSVTHAALLIGATPVLTAIIAALLRHSVARPAAWAGFGVSLAGVVIVAGGQGAGSTLGGDGLVLAAQLLSALFTVSQSWLLPGRDPVSVTAVQLSAAAVAVLPVALITETAPGVPHHAGPALALAGLVVLGTVLPTTLFAFGQSLVSADVAGAFVNLEPLVGAIAGTVVFGDPLSVLQVAGGAAIVAGIGLSSTQVVRAERARRDEMRAAAMPLPAAYSIARAAAGAGVGRTRSQLRDRQRAKASQPRVKAGCSGAGGPSGTRPLSGPPAGPGLGWPAERPDSGEQKFDTAGVGAALLN